MSLGRLAPTVQLHKPDHLYCGSDEPIEGHIRLKWIPEEGASASGELFGPAKIYAVLSGVMEVKINQVGAEYDVVEDFDAFKARIPLFSMKTCIHDGSLRIRQGEIQNFPYKLEFPRHWRYQPGKRWARWSMSPGYNPDDKMFSLNADQPMPPSMSFQDLDLLSNGEVLVQYRVETEVDVPHLDVEVVRSNLFASKEVMYERPKMRFPMPQQVMPCKGTLRVRDWCLVPEGERPDPHGFRQRASAVFRPIPKPLCVLDWCITVQRSVQRGQPVVAEICCQSSTGQSKTTSPPIVKLLCVEAKVQTSVHARGEMSVLNEKHWSGLAEVAKEIVRPGTPRDNTQTSTSTNCAEPLDGVMLDKRNEWTQTVVFENLTKDLCSSITSVFIHREYRLYIKAQVSISGKIEEIQRSLTLVVHPPLAGQTDVVRPPPSPFSGEIETVELESLPAYEA